MQSLRLALQLVDSLLFLGKSLLHLVQHLHFQLLKSLDLIICAFLLEIQHVLVINRLGRCVLILVLSGKFGVQVLLLTGVVTIGGVSHFLEVFHLFLRFEHIVVCTQKAV